MTPAGKPVASQLPLKTPQRDDQSGPGAPPGNPGTGARPL